VTGVVLVHSGLAGVEDRELVGHRYRLGRLGDQLRQIAFIVAQGHGRAPTGQQPGVVQRKDADRRDREARE
jgi:hypothetical protein